MPHDLSAAAYVDGARVEDPAGLEVDCLYPATGETLTRFRTATPRLVDQAVESAARAQRAWWALKGVERGRVLLRAGAILRERNRALSEIETLDTGKPLSETLVADAASGADALEYFGGMAGRLEGEAVDLGVDFAYTRREPHGVCAGVGAWNYPIQIACWKAAPALACGNAMVFKPSETTPLSAVALAGILIEAGAPPGLFNVVQGAGETGAELVGHEGVAKVSLTGSVATGRRVSALAGEALKPVTMELGGKSPLIVFDDALLEDAVGGAILGNFYSTGQICSNGTRVFVQRRLHDAFLDRLVERTRRARLGDPMDEATTTGPMVSRAQRERVLGFVAGGREEGASLALGGGVPDVPGFEGGFWIDKLFNELPVALLTRK